MSIGMNVSSIRNMPSQTNRETASQHTQERYSNLFQTSSPSAENAPSSNTVGSNFTNTAENASTNENSHSILDDLRITKSKVTSTEQKSHLTYYYKNTPYNDQPILRTINSAFQTHDQREILHYAINSIQNLINSGFIYYAAFETIKNKLYASLQNNNGPSPSVTRNTISEFVDNVIKLAQFRPRFIPVSYPKRTTSIEKLLSFFNFDTSDDTFEGINLLNTERLNDIRSAPAELRRYIPERILASTGQLNELSNDDNEENNVRLLGPDYDPNDDYPKPDLSSCQKTIIYKQIKRAKLDLIQFNSILKDKVYLKTDFPNNEINIDDIPNKFGINKLIIGLQDPVSLELLLNDLENADTFLFLAQKRGKSLYLEPYTVNSFEKIIKTKGLKSPTTRLPITVNDSSFKPSNIDSYPDNNYFIFPKDRLEAILSSDNNSQNQENLFQRIKKSLKTMYK